MKFNKNNHLLSRGFLYNFEIFTEGKGNTIVIDSGASIANTLIYINGDNNILNIGQNVKIKKAKIVFENNCNEIFIGNKTTIESAHIAVLEGNHKIVIGNDCMLSEDVHIRNGDSHSIISETDNKRINLAKDIIIEDHVWIGMKVNILKGVKISSNTVVGLGSIVTSDLSNNCVYSGIPARKIKENVNWSR